MIGNLPPGDYFLGDPKLILSKDLFDKVVESIGEPQLLVVEGVTIFIAPAKNGVYIDTISQDYEIISGFIAMIPYTLIHILEQQWNGPLGHKFEAHTSPIIVEVSPTEFLFNCRSLSCANKAASIS